MDGIGGVKEAVVSSLEKPVNPGTESYLLASLEMIPAWLKRSRCHLQFFEEFRNSYFTSCSA